MTIDPILQSFIVEKGLVLSAVLSSFYLLSWRLDKSIWIDQFSDNKQRGNLKGYYMFLAIQFAAVLSILIYIDDILVSGNPAFNQITLFVINLLIYGIYVLADLLVWDLLIYSKLQPKFMHLEPFGYNTSVLHHLNYTWRLALFGSVFCFLASVIAAV